MKWAKLLKIAEAALEAGGNAASGREANQLSNIASIIGQAAGAASTAVNAVNASPGGAAKPKTPVASAQKTQQKQAPTPKAGALKVNTGGYKQGSDLHKAYLKGLEQSGAKWDDKTGQIVKQSGQAYKKPGWDRKAELMAMDPMRRQRQLAIDKAHIGGSKRGPLPPAAMRPVEPLSIREATMLPTSTKPKPNPASSNLVSGTNPDGTPKTPEQIDEELMAILASTEWRNKPLW